MAKITYIEFDGEDLVVKDNDSRNGILVNRKRVTESPLKIGDLLEVGGCILMVESDIEQSGNPQEPFNPEAATIEPEEACMRIRVMLDAREDDSLVFADPCSVSIGRDPESVLVLTAPNASRHHARLDWDGEHLSVEDLESVNGIYINGNKSSFATLRSKDMMVVGGTILSVYSLDEEGIFDDVDELDEEALEGVDNDPTLDARDPTISVRKKPMADVAGAAKNAFNPEAATIEEDYDDEDDEESEESEESEAGGDPANDEAGDEAGDDAALEKKPNE